MGKSSLFADRILSPAMQPGQTVVWDKPSVHKNQNRRQAIEATECQLCFLPVNSPDFSRIEHASS